MPALSDDEDSIPSFCIQPMPDQDDPRETTETLAPPTDREAKTNPENERPRRDADNPPPRDSIKELAADTLITMQRQLLDGLTELLAPEGRLAQQTVAIAAAIDRAADRTNGTYEMLRGELRAFRESSQAKDADHDQQLTELRKEIATLRTRIDEQQSALDETNRSLNIVQQRLDAARTPQAPGPTG